MDAHAQSRPLPPKAAGLNNILNNEDHPPKGPGPLPHLRDSGFYSNTDISSKHTSSASFSANGLSPAASGYQSSTDKTPSPVAGTTMPQHMISPASSHMSVASMVSHSGHAHHHGAGDGRRLEHQASMESNHTGTTVGDNLTPGALTRRESMDSRINQGFSDLRLGNGNSPYHSNNHSTTSIQNTLNQQRNPLTRPGPGLDTTSIHRISNSYAPSAERNPDVKVVRTAPAITGPATSHIARAAEPTKGQAWAFPEDEQRPSHHASYETSRRSSITESIASSQFTADSRLPQGQRRLDDGHSPPSEYSVHINGIPHRQLGEVQAHDLGGPTGAQPYSRTPELRVSHKLAERKRRTEMKELFDALRDEMPQERGSKASKWEILTKAINEHRAQKEYINVLQSRCNSLMSENEIMRRELQAARMDDPRYRPDSTPQAQHQHQSSPARQQHQAPAGQGTPQGPYSSGHYSSSSRTELPPLRAINNMHSGPDSMTGVQYEAAGHAVNGNANGYR